MRMMRVPLTSRIVQLLAVVVVAGVTLTTTIIVPTVHGQLVEPERHLEYQKRNYTWPVSEFVPNTAGWNALMSERYLQIAEMEESLKRYQAYHMMMNGALLCPNFTEYGFGLARAPEELTKELQQGIIDGLPTAKEENKIEPILGQQRPLIVRRPDLVRKVLHGMQPYVEAWTGQPMKAHQAYGFRLYRNQSQLMMHMDRMMTHIVSFIYHIDSSDDAEPWPIFIEDFHGRTHEVILTPGDVLFYESSKCAHGRPRPFQGSWYTSVFVHYHPLGWPQQIPNPDLAAHYRVPPIWSVNPPKGSTKQYTPLDMSGMSFMEPECPNLWCRSETYEGHETIKWSGPGQDGVWIDPAGTKHPLILGKTDPSRAEL